MRLQMVAVCLAGFGLTLHASTWAQRPAVQATWPPLQQQSVPPLQPGPPIPNIQRQNAQGQYPQGQYPQGQSFQGQYPKGQSSQGPYPQVQNNQGQSPPPGATAPLAGLDRAINWLPAGMVRLQALDKVNAQANALTVKVGQSVTFGSLTILAKACVVRPSDQPADAAAYLAVSDSHPDTVGFNGWMLANEPSVSMMENPVYDIRVTGCT